MQAGLATLQAQLENEKRANAKLKEQANKDKDSINTLRGELDTLRSEFASEIYENSKVKGELVALRADLDLLRYYLLRLTYPGM
jgi:chromosome segregation ATPase